MRAKTALQSPALPSREMRGPGRWARAAGGNGSDDGRDGGGGRCPESPTSTMVNTARPEARLPRALTRMARSERRGDATGRE